MMDLKKIFLFGLVLLFISCFGRKTEDYEYAQNILDDIAEVPEWLKMNVDEAFPIEGLNVWIPTNNFKTSSLIRVPRFPRKYTDEELEENQALKDFMIVPVAKGQTMALTAVINEQISAQIALGAERDIHGVKLQIEDLKGLEGKTISKENIRVRYVKYLPVEKSRSEYVWSPKLEEIVGEGTSGNMAPNIVGDPLVELSEVDVPAYRAQPIWLTIKVPKKTKPGTYIGKILLSTNEFGQVSYPLKLTVLNKEIPDPLNYKFHLDMWVNPSAIAEFYKVNHWSDKHWKFIEVYLKEYASRGGKNITTTITHEPWHKPWIGGKTRSQIAYGYKSMVSWFKEENGTWKFDYQIFDKYVDLASKTGIGGQINAFSMTPFHTGQKIHYFDETDQQNKVLTLNIEDKAYRKVWSAFLKSFSKHLKGKGIFERTYLAFDEKPEEQMKIIHDIIANATPEFLSKTVISGHPEVGEHSNNFSISYMFFPGQPLEKRAVVDVLPTIQKRKEQGKTTTFYLCAEPAHPNTLTYSPAIEGQMIPWLALKYHTDGYLRWAFNNWTKAPFKTPVFIHTQGDDYQIYPGKNGPVSSIRWELLKEGIEDYELFRSMKEKGSVPKDSLQKAIELATRYQDGRFKNAEDLLLSRDMLIVDY
ncbi:glycoside hydrolase domain-containing protein [Tamlana sp. 2201CG12-4]|uniref:DUF4091 domain-containing protein n=1 Tax=Tamlana sp. 2201CG12-4 TaxID=3112582 RepID=UPI002DB950D8|nr:glycoside hydrolase domain-containing protein [Tamlana sp. 2201CG12-4]MEC3905530.1 glycoside hydrolase domain-containing protein [Tamlana sp. 2201CG12-4]